MTYKNEMLDNMILEAEAGAVLTIGAKRVLSNYYQDTRNRNLSEFSVCSMNGWWVQEVEEAITTLKEAGVTKIHWLVNSSGQMEVFRLMEKHGAVITGTVEVDTDYTGLAKTTEFGLVFELK